MAWRVADLVAANEEGFRTWLDWTDRIPVSPPIGPRPGRVTRLTDRPLLGSRSRPVTVRALA